MGRKTLEGRALYFFKNGTHFIGTHSITCVMTTLNNVMYPYGFDKARHHDRLLLCFALIESQFYYLVCCKRRPGGNLGVDLVVQKTRIVSLASPCVYVNAILNRKIPSLVLMCLNFDENKSIKTSM